MTNKIELEVLTGERRSRLMADVAFILTGSRFSWPPGAGFIPALVDIQRGSHTFLSRAIEEFLAKHDFTVDDTVLLALATVIWDARAPKMPLVPLAADGCATSGGVHGPGAVRVKNEGSSSVYVDPATLAPKADPVAGYFAEVRRIQGEPEPKPTAADRLRNEESADLQRQLDAMRERAVAAEGRADAAMAALRGIAEEFMPHSESPAERHGIVALGRDLIAETVRRANLLIAHSDALKRIADHLGLGPATPVEYQATRIIEKINGRDWRRGEVRRQLLRVADHLGFEADGMGPQELADAVIEEIDRRATALTEAANDSGKRRAPPQDENGRYEMDPSRREDRERLRFRALAGMMTALAHERMEDLLAGGFSGSGGQAARINRILHDATMRIEAITDREAEGAVDGKSRPWPEQVDAAFGESPVRAASTMTMEEQGYRRLGSDEGVRNGDIFTADAMWTKRAGPAAERETDTAIAVGDTVRTKMGWWEKTWGPFDPPCERPPGTVQAIEGAWADVDYGNGLLGRVAIADLEHVPAGETER